MYFLPLRLFEPRIQASKSESDSGLYYDLLLKGEYVSKLITLTMVAYINDDVERTRYRHEYNLIRANAIGDFARTIEEICSGASADFLMNEIQNFELKELNQRSTGTDWQYQAQKYLIKCLEIFDISHNPLPTKSPLKSWFSNFTLLRNKTKGHGAPRTESCALANPLLDQSINIIIENFHGFKRPWVHLHQNYSGKYRVSFLTERTNDFDFLQKESRHSYGNGVYTFVSTPLKINLLFSDVELTDFFLPNGNFTGETAEGISYISDERSKISGSEYLLPFTELPISQTEGKNNLEIIGNCFTNLPQLPDEYIKRFDLENEISKVLSATDRFPIVTLLGRGGIGKTSLALKVVRDIIQSEIYDLIIWFSSRDIDLMIEGPKQVQAKLIDSKGISEEYCTLVVPEKNVKNKLEYFSNQLYKNELGKALFIFDNFETVSNPIEVYEWINTYVRNPNKVLITSRISRNFKADYPIEIRGMDDDECKALIDLVSENLNIKHLITPYYINELINEADGHPYIMKILLGEVSKAGRLVSIPRIVAEKDQILNALFKRTFNTLSLSSKRVFLTLCSWNSSVPLIAIEAVLWRPEIDKIDVHSAIEELRKSSFIEIINEDANAFINVPLAATIFGRSELEVYPDKLLIMEDRKLLMEFGVTLKVNINSGILNKVERKFKSVAKRANTIDAFKKELPVLEYLASKVPVAYLYISDILEEFKEYELTKYYLREYIKTNSTPSEKAKAWKKLSDICRISNDWDGESQALSELIVIPNIDFTVISDASNRINQFFKNHPETRTVEYRDILLRKVIDEMSKRIHEGSATDFSRLSWLLISNNEKEKARTYVNKGLELDPNNQHCINLKENLN